MPIIDTTVAAPGQSAWFYCPPTWYNSHHIGKSHVCSYYGFRLLVLSPFNRLINVVKPSYLIDLVNVFPMNYQLTMLSCFSLLAQTLDGNVFNLIHLCTTRAEAQRTVLSLSIYFLFNILLFICFYFSLSIQFYSTLHYTVHQSTLFSSAQEDTKFLLYNTAAKTFIYTVYWCSPIFIYITTERIKYSN